MYKPALLTSVILFALMIGSGVYFIHKGIDHHFMATSILEWSKQKWHNGDYVESVKWFIASYKSALDAGIRWTVAEKFYLTRMEELRNQGKLGEALKICHQAVNILGASDDEGMTSYDCVEIEQQITSSD